MPTPLPMPQYPALMPYFDAVKDLLQTYDTTAFDKNKGDQLLQNKGWKKGSDGIWVDPQGNPAKYEILGFEFLRSHGIRHAGRPKRLWRNWMNCWSSSRFARQSIEQWRCPASSAQSRAARSMWCRCTPSPHRS